MKLNELDLDYSYDLLSLNKLLLDKQSRLELTKYRHATEVRSQVAIIEETKRLIGYLERNLDIKKIQRAIELVRVKNPEMFGWSGSEKLQEHFNKYIVGLSEGKIDALVFCLNEDGFYKIKTDVTRFYSQPIFAIEIPPPTDRFTSENLNDLLYFNANLHLLAEIERKIVDRV